MQLAIDLIRTDGNTQPRQGVNEAAVRDYALDMLAGDLFPPIVVFFDGADYWLSAGFHRLAAARQIGAVEVDADVREGGPRAAWLYAVEDNRKHGVRYTNEDKRVMVDRLVTDQEWSRWSNREIARRCGVSDVFVMGRRSLLTVSSEDRTYMTKHGTVAVMNTANIGAPAPEYERLPFEEPGDGDQEWIEDAEPRDEEGFTDQQYHAAHYLEGLAADNGLVGEFSPVEYNGDEWYTPAEYIEAARAVLGNIYLDPASCEAAQEVVRADMYYSVQDDGLVLPWEGTIWLNPPYSMPLIQRFVNRLIEHWDGQHVDAAIILTNNCTDAGWFHSLMQRFPVCFTRGRIPFWRPDRQAFATRQGQAFFYLGSNVALFQSVFRRFGCFPNMKQNE